MWHVWEEKRIAYSILAGLPERRRSFRRIRHIQRIILKYISKK
jgi:hypothetical protein